MKVIGITFDKDRYQPNKQFILAYTRFTPFGERSFTR